MKRQLLKLSSGGHDVVAEWDTDTVSKEELAEIEKEYEKLARNGWTPADITDKKDELVPGKAFNPDADTLMLPRIAGGF